jgi:hypothetical protein
MRINIKKLNCVKTRDENWRNETVSPDKHIQYLNDEKRSV